MPAGLILIQIQASRAHFARLLFQRRVRQWLPRGVPLWRHPWESGDICWVRPNVRSAGVFRPKLGSQSWDLDTPPKTLMNKFPRAGSPEVALEKSRRVEGEVGGRPTVRRAPTDVWESWRAPNARRTALISYPHVGQHVLHGTEAATKHSKHARKRRAPVTLPCRQALRRSSKDRLRGVPRGLWASSARRHRHETRITRTPLTRSGFHTLTGRPLGQTLAQRLAIVERILARLACQVRFMWSRWNTRRRSYSKTARKALSATPASGQKIRPNETDVGPMCWPNVGPMLTTFGRTWCDLHQRPSDLAPTAVDSARTWPADSWKLRHRNARLLFGVPQECLSGGRCR